MAKRVSLAPAEIAARMRIGIVGVPLGVVIGLVLWNLFAREIHAVPRPSVPMLTLTLVALGAVVVANLVAAIPGRRARPYTQRAASSG